MTQVKVSHANSLITHANVCVKSVHRFQFVLFFQTCCVAVVVPDENVVREVAENLGIEGKSWNEICSHKQMRKFILDEMVAKGNEHKLNKLEQVRYRFRKIF